MYDYNELIEALVADYDDINFPDPETLEQAAIALETLVEENEREKNGNEVLRAERDDLYKNNCKQHDEIGRLKEVQRWIPCSERLPDEGQEVEIINAQDIIPAKYEPSHNQFFPWLRLDTHIAFRRATECVTHWRLPEPPKKG